MIQNWPNAIAHIDADCFFAACEQQRRPDLAGKAICVMSSQDACVVAKTYDAKAKGITTGMPVWEAKKRFPQAIFIPADFRYYGQLSRNMFAVLERFSPQIEHYSIDEGFADLNGLRGYWHMGYAEIGDAMRKAVREEVGITVSIGVSVTRILAKMASEANKPDGLTAVPGRAIAEFLEPLPAQAIPGIGHRRTALLSKFGICTALEFSRSPEAKIKRLLGRTGLSLWQELNGRAIFEVETTSPLPKSMARTASLGQRTQDWQQVRAHLAHHVFRLAMDMLSRNIQASRFTVGLRLGNYDRISHSMDLPQPTQNLHTIQHTANAALRHLVRDDLIVNGCGIVASRISPASLHQPSIFGVGHTDESDVGWDKLPLWQAVQDIRLRYGSQHIRPATTLARITKRSTPRSIHHRFTYPTVHSPALMPGD